MANYTLNGFSTAALINQGGGAIGTGSLVNLDATWDVSDDALNYQITDDDSRFDNSDTQSGTVTDAYGNPVDSGNTTLGTAYVLDSGAQTITVYEVLVDGVPTGYVSDSYIFPGVTYEVTSTYAVDPGTAPEYGAIQTQQYDPDDPNFPPGGDYADELRTGAGDDIVGAGAGDDTVYAGEGDDQIHGGAGSDLLYAEGGNDSIWVYESDGDATIDGGTGWDTLYFVNDLSSDGANLTFTGDGAGSYSFSGSGTFSNIESFVLTDNADVVDASADTAGVEIDAMAGDDTVTTGSGADTIWSSEGNNLLQSGSGADVVVAGTGNDTIYYGPGGATQADGDYVVGGDGNDLIDDEASVEDAYVYDDTIYAGAGNDTIYTGGGDDFVDAGSGDDLIVDEMGSDTMDGGEGHDTFRLRDDSGDDQVTGGADADTFRFFGNWGSDTVFGSGTATTGADYDVLDFVGANSGVTVTFTDWEDGTATDGTNMVTFDDIEGIIGGDFSDSIDASADGSGLVLDGDAGADSIIGGSGADVIIGGSGDDTLTSGAGEDTLVVSDGHGSALITDFDLGDDDDDGFTNDQFDVSDLTNASGDPVTTSDVMVRDDGSGNALFTFPNGETLVLQGISPAAVSSPAQLYAMGIPCFLSGTRIMTPSGERPIETLREGDLIATVNAGPQPLLWHGRRALSEEELRQRPELRPILIRNGALGNRGDLLVSAQHGMVVRDRGLVRATHLLDHADGRVRRAFGKRQVTYHHLLLPRHAIILANGAESESLFPGPQALASFDPAARAELFSLFPGLAAILAETDPAKARPLCTRLYGPSALPYLRGRDLRAMSGADLLHG
ncbi:Hint domain-containing protein [Phaeobacter sp. HF9A]|uniref:Hint domain-containing protein n=1 Tax=Phaeobacter sp. HF9A TaxID=2721561 RepID=UPI001431FD08|nr:Hint domain-containing protein [Phaeobacter sp. HF9A]NIZ14315.1 hypothetical protein [Phaeobacter sp. HF9A]